MIARVVPDVTGLDKQFDYLVPDALRDEIRVGSIVRVPLGPRRVRAWVVALVDSSEVDRLKPIAALVGMGPDESLVQLGEWAAHRWAGRPRALLVAASPPTVVRRPAVLAPTHRAGPTAASLEPVTSVVRHPPAAPLADVVLAAAAHGPLLVVCPSVELVRRLALVLRQAALRVAVLPKDWAVAAGGADVVIGARAAVWGPCAGLSGVMVLDEHDEALQEERAPTWHARDVALERARRAGVPCWLVSAAPSVEAVVAVDHRVVAPSREDEREGWPYVSIVDRSLDDAPVRSLVSRELLDVCRDPDERVVCVLNTKGRARRLTCAACRALLVCAGCGSGVSQGADGQLDCARCGAQRPPLCQSCGSTRLKAVAVGVARLREELERALARPVVEVSADTDDSVLDSDRDAILIGTEAVLHRAGRATVVVFLDFDDELLAPRFRASEQAMTLLLRAAALTGGRRDGGRIIVHTLQPQHEVLRAALLSDPSRLVAPELERRARLRFPPFGAIASVTGAAAGDWLAQVPVGLEVSGPSKGRWLLRSHDWDTLAAALEALGPRPRGVRVEVNPARI